jgi:FG-GAP repeat
VTIRAARRSSSTVSRPFVLIGHTAVAALVGLTVMAAPASASYTAPEMPAAGEVPHSPSDPTVANLGYSSAISGNYAIVGAPGVNNGAGAVNMYTLSGSTWLLQATIPDPRATSLDEFGWSVAISSTSAGSYAAVGATDDNSSYDFVYVYTLSGGKWTQEAALPDPGTSNQDNFGSSVAISSTTLVVGASCVNNHSGKLLIYQKIHQIWTLQTSESDPAARSDDFFGQSLAISRNQILAGATDMAYVFTETPKHRWYRTGTIPNPGSAKDNFAFNLALSGTTALIGAPGGVSATNISSPLTSGASYVFILKEKNWLLISKLKPPVGSTGYQFGFSVAIAGNSLLVGMPLYGESKCGRAFVYASSNQKWHLVTHVAEKRCNPNDEFGYSVGEAKASGAFGAPFANALQGAVLLRKVP